MTRMTPNQVREFTKVMGIYEGSNGDATKALYHMLTDLGPVGVVAMNVFRATKCSARAKLYRGRGYKTEAYARKSWSIDNLCKELGKHGDAMKLAWGWGVDDSMEPTAPHRDVLYVDLPSGQISFHNDRRFDGPDYAGKWDQVRGQAPVRVCRWCASLLTNEALPPEPDPLMDAFAGAIQATMDGL